MKSVLIILLILSCGLSLRAAEVDVRMLVYRDNEMALKREFVVSDPAVARRLVDLAKAIHAEGVTEYDKGPAIPVEAWKSVDYVTVKPAGRLDFSHKGDKYRIYFSDCGTPIAPPLRLSKSSKTISEFQRFLIPHLIKFVRNANADSGKRER